MAKNVTLREMTLSSLFTALIAVGAFIKIPVPVVPFTLQLLFTALAGLLLGRRLGCYSVMIYILLGLVGVPVFTEGGGFAYVLKPTFGYLVGFAVGAYVSGYVAEQVDRPTLLRLICASFAGLFFVYLLGMVHCYVICNFVISKPIAIAPLFLYCFLLAVPGDIGLCFLSGYIADKLKKLNLR